MVRRRATGRIFLLAAAVLQVGSVPAKSAVRVCGEPVIGLGSGDTEATAKKRALDDWKAKAANAGAGYTNWRLAARRVLECRPENSGRTACAARATPCTIEQAPATRELRQKRLDI